MCFGAVRGQSPGLYKQSRPSSSTESHLTLEAYFNEIFLASQDFMFVRYLKKKWEKGASESGLGTLDRQQGQRFNAGP